MQCFSLYHLLQSLTSRGAYPRKTLTFAPLYFQAFKWPFASSHAETVGPALIASFLLNWIEGSPSFIHLKGTGFNNRMTLFFEGQKVLLGVIVVTL